MSRIRHFNVKELIKSLEDFDDATIHEQDLDDLMNEAEVI